MLPYFRGAAYMFKENKRWALSALAFLASGSLFIFYFQSGPDAASYLKGKEAYLNWKRSAQDAVLFQDLKKKFTMAPGLDDRFSSSIAQELLERNEPAEAAFYAEKGLKVLREKAPLYAAFSESSLLIAQGKYQEALQRAVTLKEALEKEPSSPLFFAQNLLRIASLQKALQNPIGEKAAWQEYETFISQEKAREALSLLEQVFHEGDLNLSSYIAERKKGL